MTANADIHGDLKVPTMWLWTTAAITVAPHAIHMPAWLTGLCALLLAWHAWSLRGIREKPDWTHRIVILLLALGAGVAIRIHFGHFFGKDPGIAFLAVLLCLKLLEGVSSRDIRAAILLCFFLQLGLFFFNQTLPVAMLAFAGTLMATVTLLTLQQPGSGAWQSLRTGGLMMLQAVPFLLILFLLFPRIQGPLWGLPADAYSGLSGLSDSMSPGSISQLGLSDAIAFRADFSGPPPPPGLRYWRGPVLTTFDGQVWRPGQTIVRASPSYAPTGTGYDYSLTIEPHNRRWLLALDYPAPALTGALYSNDYQLLAEQPVRARTRFNLSAYPEAIVGLDERESVLAAALRLPENSNPRTTALARRLAGGAGSSDETLARVLDHMRGLDLTYTLSPPLLGTHSTDEFLFDTRRGFCEHFAAAFVILMRAANVPARVVTGYQGGAVNPVDGTLVVRQSDAHAWAEVWLAGQGWVRVDPTALAAPSRIESGLAAALPAGDPRPLFMRHGMRWLHDIRHRWEALSNAWNQAVIGYDALRQRQLLERLGLGQFDWRMLAALLSGGIALALLALFAWAMRHRHRLTPLERAWSRFCNKLSRAGVPRLPWEGPIDYADRVARARPTLGPTVRDIASTYARLRYGPDHDSIAVGTRRLKQRISEFQP